MSDKFEIGTSESFNKARGLQSLKTPRHGALLIENIPLKYCCFPLKICFLLLVKVEASLSRGSIQSVGQHRHLELNPSGQCVLMSTPSGLVRISHCSQSRGESVSDCGPAISATMATMAS